MTKVVYVALSVVLTGFYFTSCKKKNDQDTNTIANNNKGRLVCRADGNEWISDAPAKMHKVLVHDSFFSYTQEVYGTKAYLFGDTLYFSGAKVAGTDSSSLDFTVVLHSERTGVYTIGAYPPGSAGKAAACYYSKLGNKSLALGYTGYNSSGSFEITAFSDSLRSFSGKFHFDMAPKNNSDAKTPPHNVKDGVFIDTKLD